MQVNSILITGGLGYIGSITTTEIYKALGQQFKLIIIDNFSNSKVEVIEKIKQKAEFAFHEVDIRDISQLRKLFATYKETNPINFIIHFAALKAVGESVKQPLKYYQNNVVGTINLLEVSKEFECNNFLFSSSATVYPPGQNLDEEFPFKPSNPYGETKVMVEYMIRSIAQAGGRYISLRYFNPVGGTKDGLLGELPLQPNNLFPYIEQVVVGKKDCLYVFGNDYDTPDGTGVRDYLHVQDLAEGHVVVLQKMIERHNNNENWYDYFNLGTGVGISVLDVVKAYSDVSGKPIKHQIVGRREGDVAIVVANPSKAKQQLGWEAKRGLREMCEDSYNFITKNQ